MNEDKPRSPIKDAGWLILFLIAIGVIWFAQGGPQKLTSTYPFIKPSQISPSAPASPQEESESPPESGSEKPSPTAGYKDSPYKGKVYLSAYNAKETDPQKEYLELRANHDTEPILITGWTLTGRQNFTIEIGKGTSLFYPNQINPQEDIYLETEGKAIIVTGKSPLGASFRLNICTGYFNQSQNFTPSLAEECPRIREEEIPISYPDACFDFINGLSRCRIAGSISYETGFKIGNDCILFINEKANYSNCVTSHKNDKNFYKKEWRIYLGRSEELWGNKRDNIILRDQNGKIIDEVSY